MPPPENGLLGGAGGAVVLLRKLNAFWQLPGQAGRAAWRACCSSWWARRCRRLCSCSRTRYYSFHRSSRAPRRRGAFHAECGRWLACSVAVPPGFWRGSKSAIPGNTGNRKSSDSKGISRFGCYPDLNHAKPPTLSSPAALPARSMQQPQMRPCSRRMDDEMARPREFDEDAVLDAAVQCFWSRGYEATSVRDLIEKTGITGASLYNAFGDKRALYQKALGHYVEGSISKRIRRCENLAPYDAIADFFGEILDCSLGDREHKGCMLVNAALDVAPHDPGFQEIVAAVLVRIEGFFCAVSRLARLMGRSPGRSRRKASPNISWAFLWVSACWRGCGRNGRCWKVLLRRLSLFSMVPPEVQHQGRQDNEAFCRGGPRSAR